MTSFHGETDIGRRRILNEDAIFADGDLFVVCDGMGGHKAGDVVSQLAIGTVAGFVKRSGEDAEITWPYGSYTRASFDGNRLRTAITNMVTDRRILEIVSARSTDLAGACAALIAEANGQGGRDNISAVLVQYRS